MARATRWATRLALVSSVAFCAWVTTGGARSSAQGVRRTLDQQLRVAIVIPKDGPFSIHNRLLANGATIAAREIDAPVRLQLSVVRVRPTASPGRTVRRLVRRSIRVLILPCNVDLQVSLARAAAKAGLVTLSPCNPNSKIATTLPRYWPTGSTGSAEVEQLVFYARSTLKRAKTVYLLSDARSWYARQMTDELRAFARRDKFRIVGQASVSNGPRGVARLAERIRKVAPAIVFAAVPSPRVESIISGLRQRHVASAFFVTDGMDAGIDFARYREGPYNSSIEDVVFATFGFPRPASAQFFRDYAAAYGKKVSSSFPGLGYETIHVLETAARQAGKLTPARLDSSFSRGFTVKGVALEDINYQGHGHRQPLTYVGLAEVIRDGYVPLFVSQAGHPTG